MAKFNNFSPANQIVVDKIYRQCRVILESVVKAEGTDTWRSVFGQVMGSASGAGLRDAEQKLAASLKAMHLRIAGQSYSVSYEPTFTNTNADMLSGQYTNSGGGALHTSWIDELRQNDDSIARLPMRLGPNFFTMPDRDLFGQSKVETFLHELSHHAAGTIDDTNGGECYGWTGVTRLKGLGPARAVWNAENVGFFCTWLG